MRVVGYLGHDEQHVVVVVGAGRALALRRAGDVDGLRAHPATRTHIHSTTVHTQPLLLKRHCRGYDNLLLKERFNLRETFTLSRK